jgi:hypothetical protein
MLSFQGHPVLLYTWGAKTYPAENGAWLCGGPGGNPRFPLACQAKCGEAHQNWRSEISACLGGRELEGVEPGLASVSNQDIIRESATSPDFPNRPLWGWVNTFPGHLGRNAGPSFALAHRVLEY